MWAIDFTFLKTKIEGKSNNKVKLCVVYDLGNGEYIGAKAFDVNTKNFKANKGISSRYLVKFVSNLIEFLYIPNKKENGNLIIHTDQGPEFRSKEWNKMQDKFKDYNVKLSMNTYPQNPQENACAERSIRSFKYQFLKLKPLLPEKAKTILELNRIIAKRQSKINNNKKTERDEHITPAQFRVNSSYYPDLPADMMCFSPNLEENDARYRPIKEFKQNIAKLQHNYKNLDIDQQNLFVMAMLAQLNKQSEEQFQRLKNELFIVQDAQIEQSLSDVPLKDY
uniref:Integrase catalytic domain-containing protein n=1 Tax=Derbesia sp. WEST4838 TaxID=1847751 RepID=A0A1C9JBK5_9CHLO|nr:hypothetical protein [Derbesia sp. WEST4838]AOP19226.1 hypothetical protein [Derbesia sp. WEST4838]